MLLPQKKSYKHLRSNQAERDPVATEAKRKVGMVQPRVGADERQSVYRRPERAGPAELTLKRYVREKSLEVFHQER